MLTGKHEGEMTTDFEKAQQIIAKRHWSGRQGALPESEVSDSIVEGIAWGRREGLELAARLLAKEIGKLPDA